MSDVPVTARLPWQLAALAAEPSLRPCWVGLPRLPGRKSAFALLARREDAGTLVLTIPRPGSDDAWDIAAGDPEDREAVAELLGKTLADAGRPWRLQITGLREAATGELLARFLPGARLRPGQAVPYAELAGADGGIGLSRNMRKTLARARGRIAADGITENLRFDRDPRAVLGLREEIEAAHRARDEAAGRRSDLGDLRALAFWRAVYGHYAAAGELVAATLRLGGDLAAYVVAIHDGPGAIRVLDSRMAPGRERYAPGRLAEAAFLDWALRGQGYRRVDWMGTGAPEALITVSGAEPRLSLTAASP